MDTKDNQCGRPFLKWPGGKYKLLDKIRFQVPNGNRFFEPFVGGGSVFSNLSFSKYTIADNNSDLINTYKYLKKEGNAFIDYCESFFGVTYNRSEIYYAFRLLFNSTEDARLRAALFIYLNRHSYNGLVRYNRSGDYNAPFGRYSKPYFPRKEMKRFLGKLKKTTILHSDYKKTLKKPGPLDVVYIDPPYVPICQTTNFTAYSAGGFVEDNQIELAEIAKSLSQNGTTVLISNHDTEFTRELYHGSEITSFYVQRNISCDGNRRNKAKELLALYRGEEQSYAK